jgi:hypothetical protein
MVHPTFEVSIVCFSRHSCICAKQSSGSINHHPFSIASAAGLEKSIGLPKDIEMKPSILFVAIWFLLTNTNAEEFPNPCKRSIDPSDLDAKVRIGAQSIEPQLSARFVPLLVRRFFHQPFADRSASCVICF